MGLQDKARKLQSRMKITEGRDKGAIADLIAKYPGGVTIYAADILHDRKRDTDYAIFTCKEEQGTFYFAGSVVTKFLSELIEGYAGKDEFDAAIAEEGLKVAFEEKRSKNGNVYIDVVAL